MSTPKFEVGQKVEARFIEELRTDGKNYKTNAVVDTGTVVFNEEEQKYEVESDNEHGYIWWDDNGKLSRFRSWIVQDHRKITCPIKNVLNAR